MRAALFLCLALAGLACNLETGPLMRPAPTEAPEPSPTTDPLLAGVAATARALFMPTSTPTTVFRTDRPITYVAIGASDAVGVGAPVPSRDGWVSQLHRRLPPGSRLLNLGVSGARLSDALAGQLPRAIDASPDLVTVWNVVNDLNAQVELATYERDLDRLLSELVGRTPARVLVGNCPDLSQVPVYAGFQGIRAEVARWNVAIARAAAKHRGRVYLVDLHPHQIEPALVSKDDFHPSARGYTRLAELFWEAMVSRGLVPPG